MPDSSSHSTAQQTASNTERASIIATANKSLLIQLLDSLSIIPDMRHPLSESQFRKELHGRSIVAAAAMPIRMNRHLLLNCFTDLILIIKEFCDALCLLVGLAWLGA